MQPPFEWDTFSDQPYQIKDRIYKKTQRKNVWSSLLRTALVAIIYLPLALITMPFSRLRPIDSTRFFGLGVDPLREAEATSQLIDELDVNNLLVRFPLWQMEKLSHYVEFLQRHPNKRFTVVIMQDREHIIDTDLSTSDLAQVFTALSPYTYQFQIGSTINRAKWGFFSVNEYLRFFQSAYALKQERFPEIVLIGSGVIDFEYHFTAHTLWNFAPLHYDGIAALLYVDRRGAPENRQMGFALLDKISLLSSMIRLSPKTANHLYITETNWPITGTAPYAPTSEHECVNEASYANYLVRYYLIAFASQKVDAVFWHQLIAPGYGLVDNREGIRKRVAFDAYKTMLQHLSDARLIAFQEKRMHSILTCETARGLVQVHWSLIDTVLPNPDHCMAYSRDGVAMHDAVLHIGESPIYVYLEAKAS
jgi:hypothetical protein